MPLESTYLLNLCASPKTFFKGSVYSCNRKVEILVDDFLNNKTRMVCARVRGSEGRAYKTEIFISTDGNKLEQYRCDCPAFCERNGLCKHIVALALTVDDKKLTTVKTDIMASEMLKRYADKMILEVSDTADGIVLTPTLDAFDILPTISFKVGRDKMFVVKNVDQFVKAINGGENVAYGKQLSFVHTENAFADESKALVRFLLERYDKNNGLYESEYYTAPSVKNKKMYLPPFMLDEFFSLYENKSLDIVCDSGKSEKVLVKNETPLLKVKIEKLVSDAFELTMQNRFSLIKGLRHIYIVSDDKIYKCNEEYSKEMFVFLNSIIENYKRKLIIAKEDMPSFTTNVLPILNKHLHIQTLCDFSLFAPPELKSIVYLDMPTSNKVTIRLRHQYGDKIHIGFAEKDTRQSFDLRGEVLIENIIYKYFSHPSVPGEMCIENDENALYELVENGVSEIAQHSEIFATDAFRDMRVKPPAIVSVGVKTEANLLRLHFDVQGVDMAELEEVLASYQMAKKYHRLRDGTFLSLEESSLSDFSELAQGLSLTSKEILSGEIQTPKYRALYLDALLKQSERMQYDRDSDFKKIVRDVRNVSDADYEVPQSLQPVLRNYQKTGYRWLRTIAAYGFGGILADDMGLGKTLQVLALLLAQKNEQSEKTISIVICPSSLILNWQSEADKFAGELHVECVTGTAPVREYIIKTSMETDLIITSYELLKRDIELYSEMNFKYVIADEAQYMKNQNTQNAKAVKTLNAEVRLALTGTPVENSLAEVWSVFDFLMPGYLYHYAKFRKNYEVPIVKDGDEVATKNLRKMVSPFILRRMKTDVLKELPSKIETVLYAQLEDEQKKVYIANAAAAKKELQMNMGNNGNDKMQILAMLTRMRQICCDPSLVYENYEGGSAKLEACMELVQNCIESSHRILLFSQFTSMLSIIAKRLDDEKIPYYTITGQTPVSQRLALVNDFNEGDIPIFLISLKAGGTGLNLTGADVVIHYDPWWNSSAQNQASDRAHRIGQTKTVQVYKLIVKDTLEEHILEMQKNKADLADMIVQGGDGGFAKMSKDEILALFE